MLVGAVTTSVAEKFPNAGLDYNCPYVVTFVASFLFSCGFRSQLRRNLSTKLLNVP